MVDFGVEYDLGWRHGVVIGEEQLGFEFAVFVASPGWAWMKRGCTLDFDIEVLKVSGVRLEGDAGYRVTLNGLSLLNDSRAWSVHFC